MGVSDRGCDAGGDVDRRGDSETARGLPPERIFFPGNGCARGSAKSTSYKRGGRGKRHGLMEGTAQMAGERDNVRVDQSLDDDGRDVVAHDLHDKVDERPETKSADADAQNQSEGLVGGVTAQQHALIARAFAGDDVQAEFHATKAAEIDDEVAQVVAPSLIPGWGNWASDQREPRWIRQQREKVQIERDRKMAGRADATKKNVIISERFDKKAAKFTVESLPFPFKSKEAYEGAIRVPLSRHVNTDRTHRDLTRPAVLKPMGEVIDPIDLTRARGEIKNQRDNADAKRPARKAIKGDKLPATKRRRS